MAFKNGVKIIQTAGYNGARTVLNCSQSCIRRLFNLDMIKMNFCCRNYSREETIWGKIQMVQLKNSLSLYKLIIFLSKKPDSCSTNVLTLLLNYYTYYRASKRPQTAKSSSPLCCLYLDWKLKKKNAKLINLAVFSVCIYSTIKLF